MYASHMYSNRPRVKHLAEFLSGCDPEALLIISDGREGKNRIDTTVGYVEINPDGSVRGGYAESEEDRDAYAAENPGSLWAPAVQLDTGV